MELDFLDLEGYPLHAEVSILSAMSWTHYIIITIYLEPHPTYNPLKRLLHSALDQVTANDQFTASVSFSGR